LSGLIHILEFTQVTKARQIDEEAGVLYDLVALGPVSANGRDYPESTQQAALPLLEGRQSFVNHNKNSEPSAYDLLGVWQGLYVRESKTWGNFHYFKSHPLAARLVEAARRPELNRALGFSINARGRSVERGGRQVIESIEHVFSIDCVTSPATVSGLYESRNPPVKRKLKELAESLKPKRPGYSRALLEVAEAGVMSPDAPMDAPPDVPAPDEEGDHKSALMDAMKALCDEADTLDEGEFMKKMKAIYKLIKGDSGGGGSDAGGDSTPAEESRRRAAANLQEELARLKAEKVVRKEASAAGVSLSEALVEAVARPGMTEAQARAVVNELKGAGGSSQRPKSAGPLPQPAGDKGVQESRDRDAAEIPQDAKSRAAWLRKG
jgi:hypothetical protein